MLSATIGPPVYADLEIEGHKNSKIAGLDEFSSELFKSGGEKLDDQIHQTITKIWTNETWIN